MTVSNVLSNLSKTWAKVEPIAASFSNIPAGDYIGDLKEIKLGVAKKGRTQIEVTWEVADGEEAGKTQKQFYGLSDNNGVADATGMGYFKMVCEVIGMDLPEDLNLWQEAMDAFIGESSALYDITAKEKGEYVNIFINGVSEYTKGAEGEAAADEAAEENAVEEDGGEVVEVAEEVVEEAQEEVQEVTAPVRRVVAAAKAPVKVAAKAPVKAPVVPIKAAVAAKKPMTAVAPVRKIVSLKR